MIFDTEPSIEFLFNYTQVQFLLLLFRLRRCKLSLEGKEKKLGMNSFYIKIRILFFPLSYLFWKRKTSNLLPSSNYEISIAQRNTYQARFLD